jgi:hypothetical protein
MPGRVDHDPPPVGARLIRRLSRTCFDSDLLPRIEVVDGDVEMDLLRRRRVRARSGAGGRRPAASTADTPRLTPESVSHNLP